MCFKLRTLGTPISNQVNFRWALSISERLGATRSCIQRLEDPSDKVLRILMRTCSNELRRCARVQSPLSRVPISFAEPRLTLKTMVQIRLMMKIVTAVTEQVFKTISLLECQVRNVWACSSFGSISGNQGRSNSRFANLDSVRPRPIGLRSEASTV